MPKTSVSVRYAREVNEEPVRQAVAGDLSVIALARELRIRPSMVRDSM